ncbi:MAG TPA: enediyne biosynthesis protein UnbU [Thermoanaerobaculia bacterium]|nr:enediyne biosynthesis protein UnbU [Thermoanaerobaculia bacterium]
MTASTANPETRDLRLPALRRFAFAITLLNVVGHFYLGFEQSYAQPLAALATAYSLELLLEWIDCRVKGRTPRFAGGPVALINFLLSAHISALAVAMLTYANDRLLPVMFAAAAAIGSKHVFRVATASGRSVHVFNPSNFGISATLLAIPSVAISQPYMFSENLASVGDWVLPCIIVAAGTFLNSRFTKKVPLIVAWLGGFALQALVRTALFGTALRSELLPFTGLAFLLFTFYMVTDPATTPTSVRGQIAFGLSVAGAYGLLVSFHIVFAIFFALSLVCTGRGVLLYVKNHARARVPADLRLGATVTAPQA